MTKPANHCKRWDQVEDDILLRMMKYATSRELAVAMGRSENSIQKRMNFLGVKRKVYEKGKARWTPEEVDYLRKYSGQKSLREIAIDLGRTITAVQSKAARIKCCPRTRPHKNMGYTLRGLARLFGVTDTTIISRRTRLGLDFRKWSKGITRGATDADVVLIAQDILRDPGLIWISKKRILEIVELHQPYFDHLD